ncbi:MAG: hypothetical protein Ct9H300mP6_11070 [Gammaproteobacteria bacterium]|nr:MAG: hypothetical protein Ct9H300mP6_11070 [Gammaproteobacteria bacterium]
MKHVDIYTDGACRGNPGPGGWGVLLKNNNKEKELAEVLLIQRIIRWNYWQRSRL